MHPLDYFSALALAYCLSALGERTLGRKSRKLADWNFSFLCGLSVAATALFPLSIAMPHRALDLLLVVLILAGLLRLFWKSERNAGIETAHAAAAPNGLLARGLLTLAILLCVQFAVQNHRLSFLWDGYQIWATKARVLYEHRALTKALLTTHDPILLELPNCCDGAERVAAYPQIVPMLEALSSTLRGDFDWDALKPIFPILFLSLLVSTFEAARALVPRTPALLATVLLALVPAVATRQNVGGYADMPQAMLVAGAVAALFTAASRSAPSYRHPAPWILGGLLLVKSEGAILFAAAGATIVAVWASEGRAKFTGSARKYAGAIAVAATCAALRLLYLMWMDTRDPAYGPIDRDHLAQAWERLWEVPRLCLHFMMDFTEWGIFWPLFFLAVPIVLWRGNRREIGLTIGTLLALAAYTGIFYFSSWGYQVHIEQAYSRLLCQVSPAAALVTIIAFRYLPGLRPLKTPHTRSPGES